MNYERTNSGWNRPDCELRRLDVDSILVQESFDEQDGSDRNEDVFAEEQCDVIDGCCVRSDPVANFVWKNAVAVLCSALRHRSDQWSHHLWVSTERGETERSGDLAHCEVRQENARSCRSS